MNPGIEKAARDCAPAAFENTHNAANTSPRLIFRQAAILLTLAAALSLLALLAFKWLASL